MNNEFAAFDWPPEVTTTLAVPAEPAGVVHVIDVAETTLTLVHAEPPTVTVEPLPKFVPVIVIDVPPAVEPAVGDTAVTVGAGVTKVNNVFATLVRPAEVTRTLAVPAVPVGVVHVIDVAETTLTPVHAAPPTVTVAPAAKPVPVIVIDAPPAVEPEAGDTAVTVGGLPGLTSTRFDEALWLVTAL